MQATRGSRAEDSSRGEFVFTMGLPAAGKSFTAERLYGAHQLIDTDAWKQVHPDYDPKAPHELHAWSTEMAAAEFELALTAGRGDWLYATTGTTTERMVEWMERAREAGYTVTLLYVECSLETSLRRNSRRARTVPERIVREKAAAVADAFAVCSSYSDRVRRVENDVDLSDRGAA